MGYVQKLAWLLAAFIAHAVHASPNEHSINWWHLGSAYKDAPALGWLIITFLVFVYGIVHMIKRPFSLYLETRSKDIRHQIEESLLAKTKSEEKLKLYEEKLMSLGSEIERLKAAFHAQAEAEKRERERLSKETEMRILRDAEDAIKTDYERSRNRLAQEVIAHAMALAEKTISEQKRAPVDEFLKNAFVNDLKTLAKEVI